MPVCLIHRSLIYNQRSLVSILCNNHVSFKAANITTNKDRIMTSTTNRFDDVEKKFGLSAYASPHEGFAAVVKGRYSDFVVHEGMYLDRQIVFV